MVLAIIPRGETGDPSAITSVEAPAGATLRIREVYSVLNAQIKLISSQRVSVSFGLGTGGIAFPIQPGMTAEQIELAHALNARDLAFNLVGGGSRAYRDAVTIWKSLEARGVMLPPKERGGLQQAIADIAEFIRQPEVATSLILGAVTAGVAIPAFTTAVGATRQVAGLAGTVTDRPQALESVIVEARPIVEASEFIQFFQRNGALIGIGLALVIFFFTFLS